MLDDLEALSPGFQLEFIKESFGGMAASIDDGAPSVRALLQDYFERSKTICVICGKPLHYSEEETHAVLQLFKCVVCTACKPKFGNPPKHPKHAAYEWQNILATWSLDDILNFMVADTERADQLRSSTPFQGYFDNKERWKLHKAFCQLNKNKT